MLPRRAECHPDRKHCANGLCKSCYYKTSEARAKSRKYYATNKGSYRKRQNDWINTNRELVRKRQKSWNEANRERKRFLAWKSHLKVKFGITPAQYEELAKLQNGRCAICGTDKFGGQGNKLHVDHDHNTGSVRGLLCNQCNLTLGRLEKKTWMNNAIAYLKKWRTDDSQKT